VDITKVDEAIRPLWDNFRVGGDSPAALSKFAPPFAKLTQEDARIKSVNPSTVNLCFSYSENDYVRGLRSHYASRLRLWLDIPAIVLAGIGGAFLWRSTTLHWLSTLLIGASCALSLILVAAFLVIPPLAFRREPKLRNEYSLTFSQEGIHFKTKDIDSQLQWSIYSKALIDAHSYVLYHGTGAFSVIPKRAFQGADEREAFERLIASHIPKMIAK
jgi:hypothetical protein